MKRLAAGHAQTAMTTLFHDEHVRDYQATGGRT
jgi:hypothetical protein